MRPWRHAVGHRRISTIAVLPSPQPNDAERVYTGRPGAAGEASFRFDRAFGPEASQEAVYAEGPAELVTSALDGFNVCLFAYGQTGSGKTHTMVGSEADPGFIPRAMADLFGRLDRRAAHGLGTHAVRVAVKEIYLEEVYDLLAEGDPDFARGAGRAKLDVRLNPDTGMPEVSVPLLLLPF